VSTAFAPIVSVVIACRGRVRDLLREQLHALAGQDFIGPWELLIADNGITDDITPLLAQFSTETFPIRVISAADRPGRSYAINRAVRQARSSQLITLDCDDVVAPDYLTQMNHALARHDFVGARLDSTTLNPSWLRGRRRSLQATQLEPLIGRCTAVIGAGMAFTRTAFDTVNGFDEHMLALEDLDISYRLQQAGIQPVFAPRAVVQYRYRRTYRAIFRQERSYGRYEALLHHKHRATLAPRHLHHSARGWFDVLVALTGAFTRTGRAQVATSLGAAVGRIDGSLRYGLFHL
jgi:GT2 family glycosyltransferase